MAVSAPSNLTIQNNIKYELTLDWDFVSGATKYFIYRAEQSGSSKSDYTKVAQTTNSSYTDPELQSGEKYYYRVTAYDGSESGLSSEVATTVPLPAPEGLSISNIESYSVDLSWVSMSDAPQRVYLTNEDENTGPNDVSGELSATTESYSLTSLDSDTTYTVSIRAETAHTSSEDETLTFDIQSGETKTKTTPFSESDLYENAGTLTITD